MNKRKRKNFQIKVAINTITENLTTNITKKNLRKLESIDREIEKPNRQKNLYNYPMFAIKDLHNCQLQSAYMDYDKKLEN